MKEKNITLALALLTTTALHAAEPGATAEASGEDLETVTVVGTRLSRTAGSAHVLRSKETQVHKGRTVRVLIRPPVDVQSYTRTRTDELVATVRATIVQALEESAAEPLSKPRETRP